MNELYTVCEPVIITRDEDIFPKMVMAALEYMGDFVPIILQEPDGGKQVTTFYAAVLSGDEISYLQLQEFDNEEMRVRFKTWFNNTEDIEPQGFRVRFRLDK